MSLIEHARIELLAAGYSPDAPDGPERWTYTDVMQLMTVFAEQGHSGNSAHVINNIFHKLAKYEPLVPLKGTDDEWVEVAEKVWQNRRCSRVFKDADGRAYDIDGIVWLEPSGACFTNKDSKVYVEFPYTPKTEYRDALRTMTDGGRTFPGWIWLLFWGGTGVTLFFAWVVWAAP